MSSVERMITSLYPYQLFAIGNYFGDTELLRSAGHFLRFEAIGDTELLRRLPIYYDRKYWLITIGSDLLRLGTMSYYDRIGFITVGSTTEPGFWPKILRQFRLFSNHFWAGPLDSASAGLFVFFQTLSRLEICKFQIKQTWKNHSITSWIFFAQLEITKLLRVGSFFFLPNLKKSN